MRKLLAVLALTVVAVSLASAQAVSPAAPPPPNQGLHIELSGQYDVNGVENQATLLGVRIPVAEYWSGQFRTILAPNVGPAGGVQFLLGEVGYSRSLADLKFLNPALTPARYEVYVYGGAGTARNAIAPGNASFALSIGGALNVKLGPNVVVSLIDYNYVRSRILKDGVVFSSSHQIAPGLKIRF